MSEKKRAHVTACGVCCSVCGLFIKEICAPCGSGLPEDSDVVERKMSEQMEKLEKTCSKLQCIVEKKIGYCMKDCPEFPCKNYRETLFPYSERFLGMYERRNR